MRIAIDGRALQSTPRSGVGQYTYHLLRALFELDRVNEYVVWYNAAGKLSVPEFSEYPNARVYHTRWPNKALNVGMKVFGAPTPPNLPSGRGGNRIVSPPLRGGVRGGLDIFFMPNLNFIALPSRTKLILTIHDLSFIHFPEHFSLKSRLWHRAIGPRALLKRADHIIAVSRHTKDDLMETYGIPPKKISVIYPGGGVNSSQSTVHIKTKTVNCEPMTDDFILYFGALEPRKNIEGLIAAYEALKPREQLWIAGLATPYTKRLKKRIAQSKLRERIRLIENPTEEQKIDLYAGARLFVYPSFYEGFGFPPLEAMAAGVPVVASSASSVPEICGNGAVLVSPWKTDEIAAGMRVLLEDNEVRRHYIEAGYVRAQEFSWQKSAQKMLDTFRAWSML
ncbi:glycosyltransferase family 4 protein [Candidatus Uhrbacteria bacterium]|nr:glycosyltransferase family 4 protein [Candidatus Uhrbacteria bacterium]